MKKIVGFYPPVRDQNELRDLLPRLTWYLWPWRERIGAIKLWSPQLPEAISVAESGFDPAIDRQFPDVRALIERSPPEGDAAALHEMRSDPPDLLYVWKAGTSPEEKAAIATLRQAVEAKGGMLYLVDREATLNEGSFFLWGCHNVLGDAAALIAECKAKFARLKEKARKGRVYVYGTGPSLELMPRIDVSDGDSIVCNSIVANEALLDQANPIAIVAGDPIFHAGCSQYAAGFREKLRHVLETRDIVFVTVMRDYVQQLAQLPAHLHDRVLAVPFAPDKKTFRYDFDNQFLISPETNVLTLLLLPLAAALYDHITICGCDGRPVSENQYFWSHHKGSQLSADKMKNIQEIHPAFFERSYDDHYAAHVADIARIVNELEDAGKRVDVATPSHIPALKMRHTWSVGEFVEETRGPATLVSVNPDVSNEYGHWIWYDRRMAEAAKAKGIHFVALGNRKLKDELIEREGHLRRAFTHESWGVGNVPMERISLIRLREFEASLRDQIVRLREERPRHQRVFYLYTGSIPHAAALYRVARDNPDEFFVVNTFWTSVLDCEANLYLEKWGEFLRQAQALPNLRIYALTRQLKSIIRAWTGVDLPLMPHPNPSMPEPPAPIPRASGAPFTVLFPGGMTEEKGFRDIPGILRAIRSSPHLANPRLVTRATRIEGGLTDGREQIIREIASLAEPVDAVMDDAQFLAWLADSDVAVLPYRESRWRYRNSALVIDLLYLGVPLVCCKGTWLADVLEKYGGGGIAVDGADPQAYAAAIETIRSELGRYKDDARRAARRYHANNNWPQLIDSVMAVAIGASQAPAHAQHDADLTAPISWWNNEPSPPPLMTTSAMESNKPSTPAMVSHPLRQSEDDLPRIGAWRRWFRFAREQLTQSRKVAALLALGGGLGFLAGSNWPAVAPISTHLAVVAVLAALAAAALITLRFFVEYAEIAHERLAARSEALADIAASASAVLTSRGLAMRGAQTIAVIGGLAWLGAFALVARGYASQRDLDTTFWLALSATIALGAAGLAAHALLHAARQIGARWRAERQAQLRRLMNEAAAPMQQRLTSLVAEITRATDAKIEAALAPLRSDLTATETRLKAQVLEGLAPLQSELSKLGERLPEEFLETSRAVIAPLDAKITELDSKLIAAFNETLRAALAPLESQTTDLARRAAAAEAAYELRFNDVFSRRDEVLGRLESNLSELRQGVAGLEALGFNDALARLESELSELRQGVARLESAGFSEVFARRDETLGRLESELSELRQSISRLDGLENAVRDSQRLARANGVSIGAASRLVEEVGADITTLREQLDKLSNEQFADVARDTNELVREYKAQPATLSELSERLSGAIQQLKAEVGADIASLAGAKATPTSDAAEVKAIGEQVRAVATNGFHVVNRHMTTEALNALASVLSRDLGVSLTGHSLGYMSHQIREIEGRLLGRIAAPMSDILVRAAVLLAVRRKQVSVLEIGALFGIGAIAMRQVALPRFDKVTLTFVDPLDGYYGGEYGEENTDVVTGIPVNRLNLERNLRQAGVARSDSVIIQHPSEAPEAIKAAARERYDVIIIDGDHSYSGVRNDYQNYRPLLREGGFIIFDDYGVPEWQGVTDFANDTLAQDKSLERVLLHGKTLVCRVAYAAPETKPTASGKTAEMALGAARAPRSA